MWPAGGEPRGKPHFLEILEGPLACRRLSTMALSPGESVAFGGGCMFPPRASIPSSPGGESALGEVAVLGAEISCCRAQAPDLQWASPHT